MQLRTGKNQLRNNMKNRSEISKEYIDTEKFTDIDFSTGEKYRIAVYEKCEFSGCNFSGVSLQEAKFTDCNFNNCDLSLAKLNGTSFTDTAFNECKMLGLRFDSCNTFNLSFKFKKCILNDSSFYRLHIKNTCFDDSKLIECDFTECDLTGSEFILCDLKGAVFSGTNLAKADMESSYNYIIDPARNNIKKAKFSLNGLPGLLAKYEIKINKF